MIFGNSERSQSRGRDPIVSTGRGGAGNLRASSRSRSAYDNEDDERRGRSSVANADLHKVCLLFLFLELIIYCMFIGRSRW